MILTILTTILGILIVNNILLNKELKTKIRLTESIREWRNLTSEAEVPNTYKNKQ